MIPLLLLAAASFAGSPQSTTMRGGFQDLPSIDRAVAAFTGHAVGDEGGPRTPVDARLRLAACPMVAISWRSEAHDAVVVTCSGPDWRLFVPVRRTTPVSATAPVATVREVAAPAPIVVRRGDPVLIEAGTDGFAVTREGVAAGDGAAGARVAVRVEGAIQPVQAVVLASGRVTLPGWTPESR